MIGGSERDGDYFLSVELVINDSVETEVLVTSLNVETEVT
jgi:hypothetical protein